MPNAFLRQQWIRERASYKVIRIHRLSYYSNANGITSVHAYRGLEVMAP